MAKGHRVTRLLLVLAVMPITIGQSGTRRRIGERP